jgi:hypothetical protein
MKSLFNCLVRSTLIIGVSTCTTGPLVADDAEPVGVVRISKPKSQNDGRVTQVSALTMQDSCAPNGDTTTCAPPVDTSCSTPSGGFIDPVNGCYGNYDAGGVGMAQLQGRRWQSAEEWRLKRQLMREINEMNGYPRRSVFGRTARGGSNGGVPCEDGTCDNGLGGHSCCSHQAMLDYLRCKFGYFIPTGAGGAGVPIKGHYSRVYPVNPYYSDPRDGQAYAAQGYGVPMAVPLAPVVAHTYDYSWGIPSSRLTPISHPAY